jgi:hypothetical protein
MAQSTPLNKLPREDFNQSSNDLVDDILNEMNDTSNDSLNSDTMNYSMDSSQIPPEKMDNTDFITPNNNAQQQNQDNMSQENSSNSNNGNQETTDKKSMFSKFSLNNINNMEDIFKKCFSQVKTAILIFILVMIISLPQFNRIIFTRIKGMLEESGEINIKGVLLKSIIVTILYLVISLFI